MLDAAKTKRDQAMQSLEKLGQRRKLLTDKQHKLLEKTMSSTANAAPKKAKLRLSNLLKEQKRYSVTLLGCCCSKVMVGFYCKEDTHLVTVNFGIVLVCPKNYCFLVYTTQVNSTSRVC